MSKTKKAAPAAPAKKNPTLIALIAVLVVAVILIVVLFTRSNSLNTQLDNLNTELTSTNATLQQTVTDKEAVEEQLSIAEEALLEAQATLEESTKKVADLEGQLTTLTEENNANKAQIVTLTAELETAKANKAAAEVYLANVETSIQLALNALNGITPVPTAEPTPEPAAEEEVPAVVVTEEVPAVEPAAEEVPAEEPAAEEVPTEEPAAEEVPAEEPAAEVTEVDPDVEAPVVVEDAQPEIQIETRADGSIRVTKGDMTIMVFVNEENTITNLQVVTGDAILTAENEVVLQFVEKTLPLDAAAITLDEAGIAQAVIELLNHLAVQPAEAAA